MKNLTALFILLMLSAFVYSQTIHSPGELIKIMTDSKLSYVMDVIQKPVECMDLSDKLIDHDFYRVSTDSGLFTYRYEVSEKAQPYFDAAEKYFSTHNIDSAMFYYKQTLSVDSSLFNVMTYLGQIYEAQDDYTNAIIWYKMAISKNYIDYMAHWFLADNYMALGDIGSAVDEITIARILNRNNPRIKQAMETILKKAKRTPDDWCFNPQVAIEKVSDNKINVAYGEKWVGYAIAKAIWTYEPGYKKSMGVAEGKYSILEDKECLASLLMGIENAKIKINKEPQLRILKDAAYNKFLEEYILYEIVLPQNPFVVLQLPEENILNIKDYILTYRNSK